ncbi:MAG: TonB-dependent receptor [Bacteroidota bacterium]|nr:TonB-dependent receptor [Bacteroidota bacterium]
MLTKKINTMFNKKICMTTLLAIPFLGFAQQSSDTISLQKVLDEVNVNTLRANEKTPIAFTNINKAEIEKGNLGQDLPYLISLTPSVITTSDAGTGVGYTSFRVRGSDPTRINVTVNGIPLNDSESQGVWWVNMPDFASSVDNIQIQRGVGTSTNGASAFGATVNLKTTGLNKQAYARSSNSYGSFNTLKNNAEFGTGLIDGKFALDGRLSQIFCDGYIDRATSDLKSFYLSAAYFGENDMIKAVMFSGKERTYQSWYGVPLNYLDSARTYNPYDYENEVDNYEQRHYQLHYSKKANENSSVNVSGHYSHGEGYYEQYVGDKNNLHLYYNTYIPYGETALSYYNLNNVLVGNDTITTSNLTRRKWLNNDFGGVVFSLNHKMEKTNLTFGGASNRYSGQHYGNVIWAEYASNGNYEHEYYRNIATKFDHNLYVKVDYSLFSNTNLYADLQKRRVTYEFVGNDEDGNAAEQSINLNFFNPKVGVHHSLNSNQVIYASFAVANREPNRNDYVESTPNSRPLYETLYDVEIGYQFLNDWISFGTNIYLMQYENQLAPTGKINDVGAYTRTNIDKSFRRGVELQGTLKLGDKLQWATNMTLSQNKIVAFTEYIDNWDTWGQEKVEHENTALAFSPSVIWASQFNLKLSDRMCVDFISKYVGEQFIDNTSSDDRKLDDYLTNNVRVTYNIKNIWFDLAKLTLQINNLLNNEYVSNAWVYRFIYQQEDPITWDPYVNANSEKGYNMAAYFPEATRNYLVGLTLGF